MFIFLLEAGFDVKIFRTLANEEFQQSGALVRVAQKKKKKKDMVKGGPLSLSNHIKKII